jgi:hypothetical protein
MPLVPGYQQPRISLKKLTGKKEDKPMPKVAGSGHTSARDKLFRKQKELKRRK